MSWASFPRLTREGRVATTDGQLPARATVLLTVTSPLSPHLRMTAIAPGVYTLVARARPGRTLSCEKYGVRNDSLSRPTERASSGRPAHQALNSRDVRRPLTDASTSPDDLHEVRS